MDSRRIPSEILWLIVEQTHEQFMTDRYLHEFVFTYFKECKPAEYKILQDTSIYYGVNYDKRVELPEFIKLSLHKEVFCTYINELRKALTFL